MKFLVHIIFVMLFVAGLMSCKNNDNEPDLIRAGEMVRINGSEIIDLENSKPYICENYDELRALLGNAAPMNIDFDKNVIIIIKDIAYEGISDICAEVTYSDGYDVRVMVTLNYTDPVAAWCIGAVAPNIGSRITHLTIEYLH